MAVFGANFVTIDKNWADLKSIVLSKKLNLQYDEDESVYQIFAIDAPIGYISVIYKGEVPYTCPVSQEQNDVNKADFEANYKLICNQSLRSNVTMTSSSGVPVDIANNRMLVVNFPADFGSNLWLTGRGDESAGRRGRGIPLRMKFEDKARTETEAKVIEVQLNEQFQLHDGHIDVKDPQNWDIEDEWELSVVMPANVATPAPGNDGNCNLVDMGGYNAIVPAAGDGAYNIDLATAVPLPSPGGGWDYDYFSNVLSFPANPADTRWALLDIEYEVFVQIAVNIPFSPMGMFDFDAYDAQRISPRWKIRFKVSKASNGPGTLAGWIVCFRSQNT